MSKMVKLLFGLAVVVAICVALWIALSTRQSEQACANYTFEDAVEYVGRNIDDYSQSGHIDRDGRKKFSICTSQSRRKSAEDNPFVVNICSVATEKVVATAEIYPDCGLEWRRK